MTIEKLATGVGRIVWGNPLKPTIKKDPSTGQPVLRDGQQVNQWAFGVAFPKHEFEQTVLPYLQQEAYTGFPNGTPPNFSWKYKDGDSVDAQGQPYSNREGYAGCYVLTISTEAFQPPVFKYEGNQYRQLQEGEIKTGDYVVINMDVKVNVPVNRTHTPGLYINPNGIELVGYGTEIVNSGANPDEMFGGRQYQLPPGASATPISSAPSNVAMPGMQPQQPSAGMPGMQPQQPSAGMPGMQPQQPPAGMPGMQPQQPPAAMPGMQPQQPPAGMPGTLPPPAHDYVNNVMGVQQSAPTAGMSQPTHTQTNPSAMNATTYPTS